MRIVGLLFVLAGLALGACAPTATQQGAPGRAAASPSLAHARLAIAAIERRDYAAAEGHAERASAAANTKREQSGALALRGLARIGQGREADGDADLTAAVTVDPTFAAAHHVRGIIRYDRRDYAGAVADFRVAIALAARVPRYYYWHALAAARVRDLRGAESSANALVRLQPAEANNWALRGLIYEIQGNIIVAAADYRSALSIDPNNELARSGMERLRQSAARGGTRPTPTLPAAPRGPRLVDL